MKKLMMTAFVTGALAIPTFASAQGVGDEVNSHGPYANKGQCQSALMQERNERRKDVEQRPGNAELSNSEYNALIRGRFECQQNPDGTWSVVRID